MEGGAGGPRWLPATWQTPSNLLLEHHPFLQTKCETRLEKAAKCKNFFCSMFNKTKIQTITNGPLKEAGQATGPLWLKSQEPTAQRVALVGIPPCPIHLERHLCTRQEHGHIGALALSLSLPFSHAAMLSKQSNYIHSDSGS